MMRRFLAAAAALALSAPAMAQDVPNPPFGTLNNSQKLQALQIGNIAAPVAYIDNAGNKVIVTPATPLPTSGGGGGGTGGSSADQTGTSATDGQATSTANQHVVGYNYIFNGTTWDRMRGTGGAANVAITGGLPTSYPDAAADLYLGAKGDAASATGSLAAQMQQLHIDLIAPTPAGNALIGKVGIDQTTPGSTNKVSLGTDTVKIDGSAVTQPISATALPLPTGAATAANQNSTVAGTSATNAQGVQGVTNGVPLPTSGPETAGAAVTGGGNRIMGSDGTNARDVSTTTTGALAPPTAASGKVTFTQTAVSANTSTQIAAANPNVIAMEMQCDGTAQVAIDRTGGTMTSNLGAGGGAVVIMPAGAFPLYIPAVATLTPITAYTGTAQTCRVTAYNR